MASSTTNFVFPLEEFTEIEGEPNDHSLAIVKKEACTNLMAVKSTQGGGNHVLLGTTMPNAEYVTISNGGVGFIMPPPPPASPAHPVNASAAATAERNRQWVSDVAEYQLINNVLNKITQMIRKAIKSTHYEVLNDPIIGYANVTPEQLLTHLVTNYGAIDRRAMRKNKEQLSNEWSPDAPIEDLWTHVVKVRKIAADGGDPISVATTITTIIDVFKKTGIGEMCSGIPFVLKWESLSRWLISPWKE